MRPWFTGTAGADVEKLCLIVGLGNPGRAYVATRHNAGFMVVDRLADQWGGGWTVEKRFKVRLSRAMAAGGTVFLCEPQTFMNASGEAVRALAEFHRIEPAQILVVVDDADLPLGSVRLRPEGSPGGHHGLESIERHLGTRSYPRLRLGIGRQAGDRREITGHVLGQFGAGERVLLEKVLLRACEQVECWLTDGIEVAMNRYNGVIASEERQ